MAPRRAVTALRLRLLEKERLGTSPSVPLPTEAHNSAHAGPLVWWQTQGTRVEGSQKLPRSRKIPLSHQPSLRISQFIPQSISILFLLFSHCSSATAAHATALNHHLGGFGPECARFGRGVPKKVAWSRSRASPASALRAKAPRSVIVSSVYARRMPRYDDGPEENGVARKEVAK